MKRPPLRKVVTFGAIALAALLVLREAGVLDLHWNSAVSNSEYRAQRDDDGRFQKRGVTVTEVRFNAPAASGDAGVVQATEDSSLTRVVVLVAPYEVEGLTWMPLYKTGSCKYSAKITRDGADWGTLEGSIEVVVQGLAPSRYVRDYLREQVRKQAKKTVDSWIRG